MAIAVAADACNDRAHAADDDSVLRHVRGEDAVKRIEAKHIAILVRMILILTVIALMGSSAADTGNGGASSPQIVCFVSHKFGAGQKPGSYQ